MRQSLDLAVFFTNTGKGVAISGIDISYKWYEKVLYVVERQEKTHFSKSRKSFILPSVSKTL